MPTKILEFELKQVPERLCGLSPYARAFVLLRWDGCPVTSLVVPLRSGVLRRADVQQALRMKVERDLIDCWLQKLLAPEASAHERPSPRTATIAVCTRNRPDDLRLCLQSLSRLPEDGQEVLVIDNCPSNDAAENLVRSLGGIRYVRENRPGLDCARNRALREARGEVIAFIDDDAVADPGWLRALLKPFSEPLTLAVTGLTMPSELETEAQEAFEELSGFSRGFRRKRFSLETHSPAGGGAAGAGANMALRNSLLEKVGPFDEALDAGTPTCSGGDSEMFSRIIGRGYDVVYQPAALNWHRHRRTRAELKQTLFGYGVGLYAAWTRSLFVEKEWDVIRAGAVWLLRVQLRGLARTLLKRPKACPLDLVCAQLAGSLWGPFAYLKVRYANRCETEKGE